MKRENDHIDLKNTDDFQRYYIQMYPELKYFIRKYIEEEEAANDIIQNLWLKLWEQEIVFPNESAMKAYMYRTIRNESLNYLRTQAREQNRYQMLDNEEEEPDILNKIIESEIYAMLNTAFSKLSPATKRVYIESLKRKSQKEIAEQLNISVNTVKKHINNANHSLKKQLEKILLLIALFH